MSASERNLHVAPEMRRILNTMSPYVPPVSAPSVEVMRQFHVKVKNGATVVSDFPVFGLNRRAVHEAHESLCKPGEYLWIEDAEERAEQEALAQARAYEAWKAEDCRTFGQARADRAQAAELARMPLGGFLS